jgi:hypothetical protein
MRLHRPPAASQAILLAPIRKGLQSSYIRILELLRNVSLFKAVEKTNPPFPTIAAPQCP